MIRFRPWSVLLALPVLLAAFAPGAFAAASGAIGDLYVTSDTDDMCRQYDLGTGNLVGTYFTSVNGVGQLAIHYNAASSKVLIGHFSGGVDEFDADTGAWIKTYNPGGGTQWAGIYAPNGNVYIGSWTTNDVREYDGTTGAFIGVLTTVSFPSDMRYGPSGDLFICSYDSFYVKQVDANTGAFIDQWSQPSDCRPNDLEFLPSGDILVTAMGTNVVYHYDPAKNLLGTFAGTGWGRTHGIELGPDGYLYVADGITGQVHVFDSGTFAEITPAWLNPDPQVKVVDVAFRPVPGPVSVEARSWGQVKGWWR